MEAVRYIGLVELVTLRANADPQIVEAAVMKMVVILLREKAKQWSQVTSNLSEDPGWMDIKLLLD